MSPSPLWEVIYTRPAQTLLRMWTLKCRSVARGDTTYHISVRWDWERQVLGQGLGMEVRRRVSPPQAGWAVPGGRGGSQALLSSGSPLVEHLLCTSRDGINTHRGPAVWLLLSFSPSFDEK